MSAMPDSALATIPEGGARLTELSMQQVFWLGGQMVTAGMFGSLKNAAQASVKIMAGQALGLDPVTSMRGIYTVHDNFGFRADLVASRVKASPKYDYRVIAHDGNVCVIQFWEIIGGKRVEIGTSKFTAEDAKRQSTQNMGKVPMNMLFARAMTNGVRWYCPDVMMGMPMEGEPEVIDEVATAAEPTSEEAEAEEARQKAAIGSKKFKTPPSTPKEPEAPQTAQNEPTEAIAQPQPKDADRPARNAPKQTTTEAALSQPADYVNDDLDYMGLRELVGEAEKLGLDKNKTRAMPAQGLRVAIREARKQATLLPENQKPEPAPATAPQSAENENLPSTPPRVLKPRQTAVGGPLDPMTNGQVEGDPTTYMNPPQPAATAWAKDDTPEEESFDGEEPELHTPEQRRKVMAMLNNLGFKTDNEKRQVVAGLLGLEQVVSFKTVTREQADQLIRSLEDAEQRDPAGEGLRTFFIKEETNG